MENTNKKISLGHGYYAEPDNTISEKGFWNVFDEEENVLMIHVSAASLHTEITEDGIVVPSLVSFLPNLQYLVNSQLEEQGIIDKYDDAFSVSNFVLEPDGSIIYQVSVSGVESSPTENVVIPTVFGGRFIKNLSLADLLDDAGMKICQAYDTVVDELESEYREAQDYEDTVRGMAL